MITQEVYARHRRAFVAALPPGSAALFAAAPVATRSNDVEYAYRQDNDFLYLTGFPEPEAVCLLLPGRESGEMVLFVRPRDPERETWTGRRFGVEGAKEKFGADQAFEIQRLEEKGIELLAGYESLYFDFARTDAITDRVLAWMRHWRGLRQRSGQGPVALVDPGEVVHEMRLLKGPEEIACMRRAMEISGTAHVEAMRTARPGVHEFEIEAVLDGTFRRLGATAPAYPSIVASGANATILHYTENSRQMREGELLLIDAGAEYGGYCADITRTFPVGARFRSAQQAIYDLVLSAQAAAIEAVRPGVAWDEPHQRAVEVLVDGLLELGLLSGSRAEALEKQSYRPFYMHRTGHWLGMDVHDVGLYQRAGGSRPYEPGMVVTVEPGIYVAADNQNVPQEFRGIGVRIEDDVLVTESGREVLTHFVPKRRDEIEDIRAEALSGRAG